MFQIFVMVCGINHFGMPGCTLFASEETFPTKVACELAMPKGVTDLVEELTKMGVVVKSAEPHCSTEGQPS